MDPQILAAIDIGASGGRVIVGTVSAQRVTLDAAHRFPNGVVEQDGYLRWDLDELQRQIGIGLDRIPGAQGIGIDTWGVDYGLLDEAGDLLGQPIAYRDDRTAKVIDHVHRLVAPDELYAINGLQYLPFNTIYQLVAEQQGPYWDRAAHVVLIPDLIAFGLTGQLSTEMTNASTTGLLDARTHQWSNVLLDRLAISRHLMATLQSPGEVRGSTPHGTPVITVGSHDTASAVLAVPAAGDRFAYIVSGTWSLVGVELESPVLTEPARAANFTNELGVDGRTRFLRNVGGLWLLQECLRAWGSNDLDTLLREAAAKPTGPSIDVDDPQFIPPGGMPERIAAAAGRPALTPAETVRCILSSLAHAYARTLQQATDLSGTAIDVVHIVGGGSQNELLCRLTAEATGLPVVAGPVEATALGNVLVQARARGAVPSSLEELRALVRRSFPLRRYEPS
ncbi:MAG TPA: rhamnulokinase family protein [Acidimicrobiales bacterium]